MRGTHDNTYGYCCYLGIIPAYAGNTLIIRCISMLSRDHPRVCGEHDIRKPCAFILLGSSPRMRGTHRWAGRRFYSFGIIPAYAGNTVNPSPRIARSRDHPRVCGNTPDLQLTHLTYRDHPRVCGEHQTKEKAWSDGWGSSPRMRGTLYYHTQYGD